MPKSVYQCRKSCINPYFEKFVLLPISELLSSNAGTIKRVNTERKLRLQRGGSSGVDYLFSHQPISVTVSKRRWGRPSIITLTYSCNQDLLKKRHNSFFCVTPKNVHHKSTPHFLKQLKNTNHTHFTDTN